MAFLYSMYYITHWLCFVFLLQNGLNALHLAAKEGHVNVVTELLKRGANIEAATKVRKLILQLSIVKFALDCTANGTTVQHIIEVRRVSVRWGKCVSSKLKRTCKRHLVTCRHYWQLITLMSQFWQLIFLSISYTPDNHSYWQ